MEEWKDIIGYEGVYQVSNEGRVRSAKRIVYKNMFGGGIHGYTRKERIMSADLAGGYFQIQLSKNDSRLRFKVHRLVAMAFLENPLNKPMINHIDSNRKNNHVSNLEWCTSQENYDHAKSLGRMFDIKSLPIEKRGRKGEKNNTAKLTTEQVLQIRKLNLSQRKIAALYGVSRTAVKFIQQRKNWAHV